MIRETTEAGVLTLTIDRPARRNAFDTPTRHALAAALERAHLDPAVKVVVIRGAGGTFSAGRDLKEPAPMGRRPILDDQEDWTRIMRLLHRLRVPSVAVVEGYAYAGGFTLAMACDFVLAERGARFGAMEMRNGFPAAVCTPVLAHLVGPRLALEFALFGEPIPAERLHAAGLINRLADDPAGLAALEAAFVGRIAGLDPDAVALTRETFRAARTMPLDTALDVGKHLNAFLGAVDWFSEGTRRLQDKAGGATG